MSKSKNKKMSTNVNSSVKKKNNSIFSKIIVVVLLIVIIDLIFIGFMISKPNKEENKKEDNEIKEKEKTENKEKSEDVKPKEEELTPEQIKLKELNNINERITFFKNENLDRYINYKNNNPNMDIEKIIVYVNIGLDRGFYTDTKESPKQNTNEVLTNKYYALSSDYEPNNLVYLDSNYVSRSLLMTEEAANAFNTLARDARGEGYNIRAVSTYRGYFYQRDLYYSYVEEDGVENADTYSARPGHSEHQTGLAVDVDNKNVSYTSFGNTKEFEWMKQNAYKYGFILRYTRENEWITGYKDEPWHYRYVGTEIAKYIQENPMTYEEYFVRFLDK